MTGGPAGVVVEALDPHGALVRRVEREVIAPVNTALLSGLVIDAVTQAIHDAGPVRGCAVSLPGPVGARVEIDSDVNWAALAEHHGGSANDL